MEPIPVPKPKSPDPKDIPMPPKRWISARETSD